MLQNNIENQVITKPKPKIIDTTKKYFFNNTNNLKNNISKVIINRKIVVNIKNIAINSINIRRELYLLLKSHITKLKYLKHISKIWYLYINLFLLLSYFKDDLNNTKIIFKENNDAITNLYYIIFKYKSNVKTMGLTINTRIKNNTYQLLKLYSNLVFKTNNNLKNVIGYALLNYHSKFILLLKIKHHYSTLFKFVIKFKVNCEHYRKLGLYFASIIKLQIEKIAKNYFLNKSYLKLKFISTARSKYMLKIKTKIPLENLLFNIKNKAISYNKISSEKDFKEELILFVNDEYSKVIF